MKTVMKTENYGDLCEVWGRVQGSFCLMSRFTYINKIFLSGVLLSVSKHASVKIIKYIDLFSFML